MENVRKNTEIIKDVICIIAIGMIAGLFMTRSPLNPWKVADVSTDSSVFKTVALYMQKGLMPYRDIFDHKGPIIYLINYCGNLISYYRGLWVLECFFLFGSFIFLFRTARLFTDRLNSFLLVILSTAPLFTFFESGNFTEEYAMFFIAAGVFVFSDYLKNTRVNSFRLFFCGFSFACVLMLRVNMVGIWVVFCLAVLAKTCIGKEYKLLGRFLLWFLLGALSVILPVLIWLAINGALGGFWNDYILFNMTYISRDPLTGRADGFQKLNAFITFSSITLVKISFVVSLVLAVKKKDLFNVSVLGAILINLLLIAISGQTYMHYGMVLVPLLIVPFAETMWDVERVTHNVLIGNVLLALLMIFVCGSCWTDQFIGISEMYRSRQNQNIPYSQSIVDTINNSASEDDLLSVYGNWSIIHVKTKLVSPSRYVFQYPVGEIKKEILDEYFNELQETPPRWLVVQYEYMDDRMKAFIERNAYEVCMGENENPVAMLYIKR